MTDAMRKLIVDTLASLADGTVRPSRTMGVSPHYLWWGKPWLMVRKDIEENVKASILPHFLYEALSGYKAKTDITKAYRSEGEAGEALRRAARSLE